MASSTSRSSQQVNEDFEKAQIKMQEKAKMGLEMMTLDMVSSGAPQEIAEMNREKGDWEKVGMADGPFGFNDPGVVARRCHLAVWQHCISAAQGAQSSSPEQSAGPQHKICRAEIGRQDLL